MWTKYYEYSYLQTGHSETLKHKKKKKPHCLEAKYLYFNWKWRNKNLWGNLGRWNLIIWTEFSQGSKVNTSTDPIFLQPVTLTTLYLHISQVRSEAEHLEVSVVAANTIH